MPPIPAFLPGIPNSPDIYAKAHPDRVKKFPSGQAERILVDPDDLDRSQGYSWRHELNHDAESIFWLLLYWAMVAQPEGTSSKENIKTASWCQLNGDHRSRQVLLWVGMSSKATHLFYEPLRPLIKDLATILVNDSHWLPVSDPRKDPFYITEAFQRLILNFIINNHGKEFMDRCVTKTFRKVHDMQGCNASSFSFFQSLNATSRESVNQVGCACGTMDSCPFLMLFLQGTDDGKMDGSQ